MQTPPKAKITSSVMVWTLTGSFEDRVRTAARAGMQSLQFVREAAGWDEGEEKRNVAMIRSYRLEIDLISAVPEWRTQPVSMVNPAHREGLLVEVERRLARARRMEIPRALLMSGNTIAGLDRSVQWSTLVENCKRCGALGEKYGITLVVEPLNTRIDHKGYFLDNCVEGLRLIREAGHPRVRLLFDLYHEQVQSGNVTASVEAAAPWVDIFHVADNPGRGEPGTGEMNYAHLYRAIAKTGFAGHIAMEYRPPADAAGSLIRSVDSMRRAIG
ncbi:MAG: TIM barrel protein [Bryobacteraceae bacterium]